MEPIGVRVDLKISFFSFFSDKIQLSFYLCLFYCCITVNNATMQYTRNILFNAHCHVVDLIHMVEVNCC